MKILNIEMNLFFCTLTILIRWAICKSGLIQEIIPWDEKSKDVMPSTRSIQSSSNVLARNYINDFDSVVKQHQGYIQKVRGFFKAPEAGEYKFYSSCSAPCQIFIGQDDKVKPKQIIAQKEESLHNEFNRYPDQVSHTIYLEKDRLYFIEGIEKQHGGLGHLSVGVVLPNDKKILPISKSYLRSNGIGQANRKGEILRSNGKELTRQRDKMFTKLKEINEYIRKLTDAVKRNPIVPEAKDAQISAEKTAGNKNYKSARGESTDIVGEEQKDGIEEMKKYEHMKDTSNSMGHITRRKNDRQRSEEGVTEKPFDTKEIDKIEKTEITDEIEGKIPKERKGMKIQKDDEEVGTGLQGIQGRRKKGQDFNERIGDYQKSDERETVKTDHDNRLNKTGEKGVENKVEDANKSEQNLDTTDLSNGERLTATSQIVDNLNKNTEAALKPNDNFMVEHNYIKVSRSRDHSDGVQSENLYGNYDVNDEDEIIQLTNYAKEEIAKHGDLSEKAIKNIIQIIKRKLINEGFLKPRNKSMASTATNERKNSTENAANKATKNKQGSTTESKQNETKNIGKGRILLYDKVVSNLVNAIKESSQPQADNQQGSKSDRNGTENRLEEKSEMINAEKEQRKRMLSSLYLLSSEIENFKQFLGGTQNKDKLESQKLEKEQAGNLKDETGNKQTTIPSVENIQYESNAKKFNTKLNGIINQFPGDNEMKQEKNEEKVEKLNQTKSKYSSYAADRSRGSSFAIYKAQSYNEEIRPGVNAINLGADDDTARYADHEVKQSRNITPNLNVEDVEGTNAENLNVEDGEGTNAENFRYTKEPTKHVFSKPMLDKGYESLMARIRGQNIIKREKQNSHEGRNDITNTENAQGQEALIAVNASKRNSYTNTLAKTVEQYLTGMTVPALLGEKTPSIQSFDQRSNDHTTDARELKSNIKGKEDYKASQRYRIAVKNVLGDKKTHIMKRLKKKDSKRRWDARVTEKKKGK